ncbi:MAG: endonuclease/exonuclease/phosphatase family protein [Caldilineaceae bacterium]|nr:endonuclease/exonuclease/phosphatase family protein [Caldilineaceae bacterium]
MRTFLFSIGLLASILTLGSLLGRFNWTLDALAQFHLQYTFLLAVVIGGLIWLGAPRRVLLLLPALLVNLVLFMPFLLAPSPPRPSAAGPSLRVMSINISLSDAAHPHIIDLIRREEPDIVYLSEVREDMVTRLRSELGESYPVQLAQPSRFTQGVAILARDPNAAVEIGQFSDDVRKYARADFTWQGRPVTLLGIHPLPPTRRRWSASRDKELEMMAQLAREIDRPFILMGDLNASPWSSAMQTMTRQGDLRYADPRRAILPTFFTGGRAVGLFTGVPLDHILVTPEWSVSTYRRLSDVGSDHIPVRADLVLQ